MEAWTELKAYLFAVGATIFLFYPLVVLAWTVAECRGATALVAGAAGPDGGKVPFLKAASIPGGVSQARAICRRRRQTQVALVAWLQQGISSCWWWRPLRYAVVSIVLATRLVAYSLLMSPWFIGIAYAYIRYPHMLRGLRVGPNPRNYVDVILPPGVAKGEEKKAPVVIAVMGGAWVIGHRAWNALLALRLAEAGVVVVAVDYRNFPLARMDEMVEDVGCAFSWVFANIEKYGGDRGRVAVIGQSAGAHLSATVILERALAESRGQATEWVARDLKGFVGVSGVYDMVDLEPHLEERGLYPFLRHMCPGGDIVRYSPVRLLEDPAWKAAAAKCLPPVRLFHGALDRSVPSTSSSRLAEALLVAGASDVSLEVRQGMGHVAPVVQDPLTGGDLQVRLVLSLVVGDEEADRRLAPLPPPWPAAPRGWVRLVSLVMPF